MKEREIYLMNLDVQNRQKDEFFYRNEEKLEEILETINRLKSSSIINYEFGVGEIISYLKDHEVKCKGYSQHGVSYSFAKKLFNLDVENDNGMHDLLIVEGANIGEINHLFTYSDTLLLVSPMFNVFQLDPTIYTIDKNMYTAVVRKKRQPDNPVFDGVLDPPEDIDENRVKVIQQELIENFDPSLAPSGLLSEEEKLRLEEQYYKDPKSGLEHMS